MDWEIEETKNSMDIFFNNHNVQGCMKATMGIKTNWIF